MSSSPFLLRVWWLAQNYDAWLAHRAECAILGHVRSDERPETCWWCLATMTTDRRHAMSRIDDWIARINHVATHPVERAQRCAECALLGHEPSGEFFCTTIPTHVCYWCLDEFQPPHVAIAAAVTRG